MRLRLSSYRSVRSRLFNLQKTGSIYHLFSHYLGISDVYYSNENHEFAKTLFKRLIRYIDQHKFPLYVEWLEELLDELIGEPLTAETVPPLGQAIIFDGISYDDDFEEVLLVLRLASLVMADAPEDVVFCGANRAADWYAELAATYNLPPLAEFNLTRVSRAMEDLPPPWDGLLAACYWLEGIGNPFTDISPLEVGYFSLDYDWCVADIESLAASYREAQTKIIDPVFTLDTHLTENPDDLKTLFDLALGRRSYLLQDGEIIFTEPEVCDAQYS